LEDALLGTLDLPTGWVDVDAPFSSFAAGPARKKSGIKDSETATAMCRVAMSPPKDYLLYITEKAEDV